MHVLNRAANAQKSPHLDHRFCGAAEQRAKLNLNSLLRSRSRSPIHSRCQTYFQVSLHPPPFAWSLKEAKGERENENIISN
jgi:hypothetical protein